jgi:phosphatidylserine decarboxylase
MMTKPIAKQWLEWFNYRLTNIGPRRQASIWMGRVSRIQSPRLTRLAIWIWNHFDRLELEDSPPQTYASIQACFTRPIRPETRPIDQHPDVLISPCDAILGAHGRIEGQRLYQIKGKPYLLEELIGPVPQDHPWRQGYFVTLRIKASMYHRFHAPADGQLVKAWHRSGDAWNVNPATLKRVDRLFCQNERACLSYQLLAGESLALVPVAAVWVAGIRVHALQGLAWHDTPQPLEGLSAPSQVKGEEMGWFEHGSTIVVITPDSFELVKGLEEGHRLKMGQALLRRRDRCA